MFRIHCKRSLGMKYSVILGPKKDINYNVSGPCRTALVRYLHLLEDQ